MPVVARVVPESTAMTNSQLSVINHRVQSKPLNVVRDNACTHWLAPHAPGTLRRGATPRLQFQVSSRQHAGTALWAAGVDSGRLISVVKTGRCLFACGMPESRDRTPPVQGHRDRGRPGRGSLI